MSVAVSGKPRRPWPTWTVAILQQLAGGGLLFLLGSLAMQVQIEQPPVPLFWPASGVALALVWRFGERMTFAVVLAVLGLQLAMGAGWIAAALIALATGAAAVAGRRLLNRFGFEGLFHRMRDVGLLLAVGGGVTSLVSAVAGSLAVAGLQTGLAETFGLCWVADLMGMLLLAPLVAGLGAPRPLDDRDVESLVWIIAAAVLVTVVYAGGLSPMLSLPLSYTVFPLVIIVALRRPPMVTMMLVLVVAAVALTSTTLGEGPFAQADLRVNVLSLHAHLAILALTGLVLGAARAERDTAVERARRHLRTLARAGRLDAMSTMAASIAHEINQPLCAVNSYAQAAQRLLREGRSPTEVEEALDRIVAGNEKASAIVRRVRDFLRQTEDERLVEDANRLVGDAIELLVPEFRHVGVGLVTDLDEAALPVRADAVAIRQVVVNLVQNGLEAILAEPSAKGGEVRVRTRRGPEGRTARLEVRDTGPGLPEGRTEALFEPLVSYRRGGTGLGLAIVQSIAEAHGGSVTAANGEAGGAVFRICLPLAAE